MGDDADKPESGGGEAKPPKIKAEDNPWYLLATLYDVPGKGDEELREKNRTAWNRYFAANLDVEARTRLIEEKRHPAEELRPFSSNELREVATAFAERSRASANKPALPASYAKIDFSNVEFEFDVSFAGYRFSRWAVFEGATFSGEADFGGATFPGGAVFPGAIFSRSANFHGATFSGAAYFQGATFSGTASFQGAAFSVWADFFSATFSFDAYFQGATFSGGAVIGRATFSGGASFDGATFSGHTGFGKTTFGGTTSFVNAEMKDETSFEGAIFETKAPKFFGAKLHQGTVWRGIKWPTPKNKNEAAAFIDAYACLKLEMDRLKKHEDELKFFALEMQSQHVELGTWKGLPNAIYGVLSNYGRSYLRPLVALCVVAAIGAGAFWYFDARTFWEALGLSATNTLNVFGFRKDFFDAATIEGLPAPLKILAAVQTILGATLLFLFGLGIRNKFRMK
jgi:uncharacterized protein YjbI with pentapeptide repeats